MKAKLTILVDYAGQDALPDVVEPLLRDLVAQAWENGHFQHDFDLVVTKPRVTVGILPDGKDPLEAGTATGTATGKGAQTVKAAAAMAMAFVDRAGIHEWNGILLAAQILGIEYACESYSSSELEELIGKIRTVLAE